MNRRFAERRAWRPRPTGAAFLLIALLTLSTFATAETLKGIANNGTTSKPAGGDDVVLLSLSQGMTESGRTKSDASGHFSFNIPDPGGPHLVRVAHQGVNYFKMAPPGTDSVEVQVYDVAKKLEGVTTPVEILRFETDGSALQVLALYSVSNKSAPPRALMTDRTFEIALPDGAQIDNSAAQGPGGQPVSSPPVPVEGKKGHYYFVFPIRPGETRFQVAYHLPYPGQIAFKPTLLTPLDHFVAVMPKSLQFTPDNARTYQNMPDDPSSNVQVVLGPKPGDAIGFKLAGTGTFPAEGDAQAQPQPGGEAAPGGGDQRPGGGLGAPIDAPDPLTRYRWYILAGFAAVLAVGAFYSVTRTAPVPAAAATEDAEEGRKLAGAPSFAQQSAGAAPASGNGGSSRSALLLEAMKEELFQLEVERQQGKISASEYQKAKAALDETIKRALSRTGTEKL